MDRLAVVDKTHDLVCWLIPIASQFPREQGAQVGERLSTAALELLDLLVEAQTSATRRREALVQAGVRVERTGALLRLARDLGVLGSDAYDRGTSLLAGVKQEIEVLLVQPDRGPAPPRDKRALTLGVVVILGIVGLATFYRPPSRFAALDVRSQPPGASVTLDGAWKGNTPVRLESIPAGAYAVELSLPGHHSERRSVNVEAGKTLPLDVSLSAEVGGIVLLSRPEGVDLVIDGKVMATHLSRGERLAVDPGTHSVEVRRLHYQTWRTSVTVAPDRTVDLDVVLKPSPGVLRVDSVPPGARVLLNGRSVGLTPVVVPGLRAVNLKVRVEKDGHQVALASVRVRPGETVPLRVKMLKRPPAPAPVVWQPVRNQTHSHSF